MKTTFIVALSLLALQVNAQKNHFNDAEIAFNNEHYYSALEGYKKAESNSKKGGEKGLLNYKIGQCYAYMLDYAQAEVYLKRADKLKYDDTHPELHKEIGLNYLKQGAYKDAKASFEIYLKYFPTDQKIKQSLQSCETAMSYIAAPTRHEIYATLQLNTNSYEFSPHFVDRKSKTLLFTSNRPGSMGEDIDLRTGENFADIWYATIDNKGKWGEPQTLPNTINTEHNEATPYLNAKKDALYFTRCNVEKKKNLGCDIYYSKKQGTSWKQALKIELKPEGADSLSVGHPAVSKTEKFMIFAGDLPNGYGGKDLWITHYNKREKTWGAPSNLGAEINTAGDEVFPYLKNDTMLYFSSNGRVGLGGLDLFSAHLSKDKKCSNVENLRYPINSAQDDFGIIYETKTSGYLSSNRNSNKKLDNLFQFKLPEIKVELIVIVYDKKTNQPIKDALLTITNSDNEILERRTDLDGQIHFKSKEDKVKFFTTEKNYKLNVQADSYFEANGALSTLDVNRSKKYIEEFYLYQPIEYDLPEVRYDYADSALQIIAGKVNSKDSLNNLYDLLIANPTWVVELQAHTDCRGPNKYNKTLSQGRANKCVEHLVSKGIDINRLVPVGYGETTPREGLDCKSIQKMNTEEEREAAHQRNRRTQFKLLSSDYKK